MFSLSLKKDKYKKTITVVLFVALVLVLIFDGGLIALIIAKKIKLHDGPGSKIVFIKPANAAELYSEFLCPCCGKLLDPENICCGGMKQRIDFVDAKVASGFSHEDIILSGVREFGINSLIKDETKNSIREILIVSAPEDSPRIVFENERIDLGVVSQASGVVIAYFEITNNGDSDLIIDNLNTSCGCTSVSVVYNGVEGSCIYYARPWQRQSRKLERFYFPW